MSTTTAAPAAQAQTPLPLKDDYASKLGRRRELRGKTLKYWEEDAYSPKPPLDSSLKKHTTLLNRLRSALLTTSSETLIKEIDGLTLKKYAEEIQAAVLDGVGGTGAKGKADVEGAVEVITHLHSRLTPDFYPSLLPQLLSLLSDSSSSASSITTSNINDKDREKEEKDRISRLRPVLRVLAELALVGAWVGLVGGSGRGGKNASAGGGVKVEEVGAQHVFDRVQGFMTNDPQYNNIPLLVTFLKSYKRAYLGPDEGIAEGEAAEADELVPAVLREKFRASFEGYFKTASKALVKGHTKLLEQDKKNQEAYIKAGEIFEDRQHAYERMTKTVEKLQNGVQNLADLLNHKMPTLPSASSVFKSALTIVETGPAFGRDGDEQVAGGIWDDEEERKFYEDVLDLADAVPPTFLGRKPEEEVDAKEAAAEKAASVKSDIAEDLLDGMEADGEVDPEAIINGEEGMDKETAELIAKLVAEDKEDGKVDNSDKDKEMDDKDDVEGIDSGPAARLAALFAALPEANNRAVIDKLAVDFTYLNSKPARKRCYKFLGSVPKARTDLLPHYARFAATLNKYMPDIGAGLIAILDEEFKYLQRKRLVKELDSVRAKNIKFYGELAKFKVAQPHTVLHVLQVCLNDLSGPNVDNVANLLETCGRFLLRSEETSEKAKALVEVMRRKQSAQHFDARQQLVLENAYYQCNPPERVQREQIQLTPMEAFIRHLLHDVLMKKTVDKVLKLIRKLHWEDPVVFDNLTRAFTEVWELKFGDIPLMAMLVYDLQKYHLDFSLGIVDHVLEAIRSGVEDNIFKYNQRRIATIKYLGELYMYRVVSTPVVFDVLWSLMSFGHAEGLPYPGRSSALDASDDFFRIRLITALLDTCGACFDKGSSKKKLDQYLVIFQLYCLCKVEMPLDVDFMVSDTLEMLRPKMTPFKTFQEAAEATDEMLAAAAQMGEIIDDDEGSDAGSEADPRGEVEGDEDEQVDETSEKAYVNGNDDDEEEEKVILRNVKEEEFDQAAEDEFNREFAKLLADTTDIRRPDRKTAAPVFDTAVPLIRKANAEVEDNQSKQIGANSMKFALLSKKGNKQQIRSLDVPIESAIAVNTRTHQERTKQEQEQMKQLVLQNEKRQEQTERAQWEASMRARGIKVRHTNG